MSDVASPRSPLEALDQALTAVGMPAAKDRPVPPPRHKQQQPTTPKMGRRAMQHLSQTRPESDCGTTTTTDSAGSMLVMSSGLRDSKNSNNSGSDLPDRHRSLHVPAAPLEGKKLSRKHPQPGLMASDDLDDYAEIYTPSSEDNKKERLESMSTESSGGRTGSGDSGLTGLSSTGTDIGKQQQQQNPPPLPVHR